MDITISIPDKYKPIFKDKTQQLNLAVIRKTQDKLCLRSTTEDRGHCLQNYDNEGGTKTHRECPNYQAHYKHIKKEIRRNVPFVQMGALIEVLQMVQVEGINKEGGQQPDSTESGELLAKDDRDGQDQEHAAPVPSV